MVVIMTTLQTPWSLSVKLQDSSCYKIFIWIRVPHVYLQFPQNASGLFECHLTAFCLYALPPLFSFIFLALT